MIGSSVRVATTVLQTSNRGIKRHAGQCVIKRLRVTAEIERVPFFRFDRQHLVDQIRVNLVRPRKQIVRRLGIAGNLSNNINIAVGKFESIEVT